jgi:hypothetical protein
MRIGRIGLRFLVLFVLAPLSGCVIPGMITDSTDGSSLLPVPRRVNYNVFSDPFYPRTDVLVYKCKKDGTMVLVPVGELDQVGLIGDPDDDPDGTDFVDAYIDPMTGSYTFTHSGRYDIVVSYNNGTINGRYSVWVQDPLGLVPDGPGGGDDGGGIGILWGN